MKLLRWLLILGSVFSAGIYYGRTSAILQPILQPILTPNIPSRLGTKPGDPEDPSQFYRNTLVALADKLASPQPAAAPEQAARFETPVSTTNSALVDLLPKLLHPNPPGYVAFTLPEPRGIRSCKDGRPGWFITGEGPEDYRVSIQEDAVQIQALHDKNRPLSVEVRHCATQVPAPGSIVRVRALVKAEVRDYANLHIRAYNENWELIGKSPKSIRGTFDWKEITTELLIPHETTYVIFGALLESTGRIWIRQVAFTASEH